MKYSPKSKSLELFGALGIDGGVEISTNTDTLRSSGIQAIVDVFLSYPLETKLKYEWYPPNQNGEVEEEQISREFNHGPALITVNVKIRAGDVRKDRLFDWELININLSHALTDKVFNKCCFELSNLLNCIPCR